MSLIQTIEQDIKDAMLSKNQDKLLALRAMKSALMLAQTESGAGGEVSDADGIKILQKLVKQRQESASIYKEQGRQEMADKEEQEAGIISAYMPEQMGEEEIKQALEGIIANMGASGMQDMGKVMGAASKEFAGKADNRLVSDLVKSMLS